MVQWIGRSVGKLSVFGGSVVVKFNKNPAGVGNIKVSLITVNCMASRNLQNFGWFLHWFHEIQLFSQSLTKFDY